MGHFHLLENGIECYFHSRGAKWLTWGGESVIPIRNEGISSCNLSINTLKTHWILNIVERENPAGKKPHCDQKNPQI